ncbi:unnamed protein product [Effrenium voratum]|nr:unnamed protein product [Effrenium voratum]
MTGQEMGCDRLSQASITTSQALSGLLRQHPSAFQADALLCVAPWAFWHLTARCGSNLSHPGNLHSGYVVRIRVQDIEAAQVSLCSLFAFSFRDVFGPARRDGLRTGLCPQTIPHPPCFR